MNKDDINLSYAMTRLKVRMVMPLTEPVSIPINTHVEAVRGGQS